MYAAHTPPPPSEDTRPLTIPRRLQMDVWCNLTAASHSETACRTFRMQLVVELGDGSVVTHVSSSRPTEARWYGRQGPIVYDHEYHGEQKDGRMVSSSHDSAALLRDSFRSERQRSCW